MCLRLQGCFPVSMLVRPCRHECSFLWMQRSYTYISSWMLISRLSHARKLGKSLETSAGKLYRPGGMDFSNTQDSSYLELGAFQCLSKCAMTIAAWADSLCSVSHTLCFLCRVGNTIWPHQLFVISKLFPHNQSHCALLVLLQNLVKICLYNVMKLGEARFGTEYRWNVALILSLLLCYPDVCTCSVFVP